MKNFVVVEIVYNDGTSDVHEIVGPFNDEDSACEWSEKQPIRNNTGEGLYYSIATLTSPY